jgi:hypothetical protein
MDFVLLAALVAYSGAGGVTNITLSNWARDKGYGMGERAGYISAAIGGKKVNLAHSGFIFPPEKEMLRRWDGWWRIVRADQWGVFFGGALLGMLLPGLLYVAFLEPGTDIRGLGISAALASGIAATAGPTLAVVVAFLGAWILFKTQLDQLEGWCARSPTSSGPGASASARCAGPTCAWSTTRCSRWSWSGGSPRCDWCSP